MVLVKANTHSTKNFLPRERHRGARSASSRMAAMEMEYNSLLPLTLLAGWCALAAALLFAISAWLQRPRRIAEAFRRQGIDGPPPSSFLSGNLSEMQARAAAAAVTTTTTEAGGRDFQKEGFDDYCKRIFPYFEKWRKAYGTSPSDRARACGLFIYFTSCLILAASDFLGLSSDIRIAVVLMIGSCAIERDIR